MIVLHVLDHSLPLMSGYSTRSRSIVNFQAALGLRPVVLTSPKHAAEAGGPELLDGIPHYRTPVARAARPLPYAGELRLMRTLARRIAEVARAEGARILHAHSPVLNGLPALWAGRRLRLPVVYEARAFWEDAAVDHGSTTEGSLRYRVSRALETLVFRRADRVITIAEAMRREVSARGVPGARITVVPNGVDPERFVPVARDADLAKRFGLDHGPVLGFIGSFYHYEGLRFLIDAVPALRRRLPGARVLLVGGGPEEAALRAAAAPHGDAIVFTGRVPHESVADFYALLDVFVCPRRRMRLTELVTPLKPLEAMAMGCPVLASDVGGHAELIQSEVTGVLFPADSQAHLVAAATRLMDDAGLRARLARSAREMVVRERSWRQVVARYLHVYGTLV